jgi:type III secretory pathway component EscU
MYLPYQPVVCSCHTRVLQQSVVVVQVLTVVVVAVVVVASLLAVGLPCQLCLEQFAL